MSERLTEHERRALDDLIKYVELHDQKKPDIEVSRALAEVVKGGRAVIAERAKPSTDAIAVIRENVGDEVMATPRLVERAANPPKES